MGFSETSLKWRCAFFLCFIGFLMMIASIASSYMAEAELIPNRFRHIGFWDMCDDTQTYGCQDMVLYLNAVGNDVDWVHGCRAMVVIGVILEGVTLCIALWMAYMASGVHIGNLFTAGVGFLSILFNLIGGIVYLVNAMDVLETTLEMDSDPSWSFAVLIIAQGLYLFAGILQIYEACRST